MSLTAPASLNFPGTHFWTTVNRLNLSVILKVDHKQFHAVHKWQITSHRRETTLDSLKQHTFVMRWTFFLPKKTVWKHWRKQTLTPTTGLASSFLHLPLDSRQKQHWSLYIGSPHQPTLFYLRNVLPLWVSGCLMAHQHIIGYSVP